MGGGGSYLYTYSLPTALYGHLFLMAEGGVVVS